MSTSVSFYEEVGGAETFARLVARFYEGVASDAPMRALYPEEDLGPAERRLRMFLEQYFGGPKVYSEERGHPRLRMRHVPYAVTLDMRDRWLRHMTEALDSLDLPEAHAETMREYFVRAADMLVNTHDTPSPMSHSQGTLSQGTLSQGTHSPETSTGDVAAGHQ